MIAYHISKSGFIDGLNVLEIGSGAGAFIDSYTNKLRVKINGYYYSDVMISIASEAIDICYYSVSNTTKNPFIKVDLDNCYMYSATHCFDSK